MSSEIEHLKKLAASGWLEKNNKKEKPDPPQRKWFTHKERKEIFRMMLVHATNPKVRFQTQSVKDRLSMSGGCVREFVNRLGNCGEEWGSFEMVIAETTCQKGPRRVEYIFIKKICSKTTRKELEKEFVRKNWRMEK